jgi:hypothetical protein
MEMGIDECRDDKEFRSSVLDLIHRFDAVSVEEDPGRPQGSGIASGPDTSAAERSHVSISFR